MPYSKTSELPAAVKNNLPAGAQKIWMAAHNAAIKQYHGDEEKAAAVAWAAVKNKYKKNQKGEWVAKDAQFVDEVELEEVCDLSDAAGANMRITADGYLVASPRIARTGIQLYRGAEVDRPDLEVVRVYRPADQVFNNKAMASLAHRPVTFDHPDENITSRNWRAHAVGYVAGEVARDGDFIRVPLALMDQDAIEAVKDGHAQLSVGYGAKLVWGDGKTDSGEQYDAMQTDIRANHIAVVKRARGGDNLRMGDDSDDLFDREFSTKEREKAAAKGQAMSHGGFPIKNESDLRNAIKAIGRAKNRSAAIAHIKKRARALGLTSLLPEKWGDSDRRPNMTERVIDGVRIELEDRDDQILARHLDALNKQINDAAAALTSATAKAGELQKAIETKDGEIIGLTKKLADAEWTPQKRDQAIRESMEVFDRARRVLGDKLITDGKTEIAIKREVVAAELGDEETKAMSDEAIAGVFRAVTRETKNDDGLRRTATALSQPLPPTNVTSVAYQKYVDRLVNAHKHKSA